MKTFKRTFVLRTNALSKKFWKTLLLDSPLTLNASKVGRHRRGKLLLKGGNGRTTKDGYLLELEFVYERRRTYDWRGLKKALKAIGMGTSPYRFTDHNKLLKMLTEASVR